MSRPRKPGQLHKGWKKANKRLKKLAAAPDPAPEPSTSYKGIDLIPDPSMPEGTAYLGYLPRAMFDHLTGQAAKRPPPTSPPHTVRLPAGGGEARSSGITDAAADDTDERTRDS